MPGFLYCEGKKMIRKNFYEEVEIPGILKNVIYSDTDSIYIVIPTSNKNPTIQQKIDISQKKAVSINNSIKKYLNEYLLPKMNINPKYNYTDFKSELLIDSIVFIDVKKNYSYKILVKDGKIFEKPIIQHKGIQIVRSNSTKFTQDILTEIIEGVLLNSDIDNKEKFNISIKIINKFKNKFDNNCKNFQLHDIGIPGKYGKNILLVNGMNLYNFITNKTVFTLGSSGLFIYCEFLNKSKFSKFQNMEKTRGVCIPYNHISDDIKTLFKNNQIKINTKEQWERIFTTTCHRILNVCQQLSVTKN